jgi:hypothetical protein
MTSGEVNPFTLVIGYDDNEPIYYKLTASYEGQVTFEGPTKEPLALAQVAFP